MFTRFKYWENSLTGKGSNLNGTVANSSAVRLLLIKMNLKMLLLRMLTEVVLVMKEYGQF